MSVEIYAITNLDPCYQLQRTREKLNNQHDMLQCSEVKARYCRSGKGRAQLTYDGWPNKDHAL